MRAILVDAADFDIHDRNAYFAHSAEAGNEEA